MSKEPLRLHDARRLVPNLRLFWGRAKTVRDRSRDQSGHNKNSRQYTNCSPPPAPQQACSKLQLRSYAQTRGGRQTHTNLLSPGSRHVLQSPVQPSRSHVPKEQDYAPRNMRFPGLESGPILGQRSKSTSVIPGTVDALADATKVEASRCRRFADLYTTSRQTSLPSKRSSSSALFRRQAGQTTDGHACPQSPTRFLHSR